MTENEAGKDGVDPALNVYAKLALLYGLASLRYLGLLLGGFLLISACSDTVTTRFETYMDARNAGAFERGWLPPDLPRSASNIVERNNLDQNIGSGSFDFKPEEAEGYIDYLKENFEVNVTSDNTGNSVEVSRGKVSWVILLPHDGQSATYQVSYR